MFIKNRDVDGAIAVIKSCPNSSRESVWHLNLAFLEAYRGDMKKALQHYRNAVKFPIEIDTLNQLETFIIKIVAEEPEKSQLYFCLGYINWIIKGDNLQAIKDYQRFLDTSDEKVFPDQVFYAKKWINELMNSDTGS